MPVAGRTPAHARAHDLHFLNHHFRDRQEAQTGAILLRVGVAVDLEVTRSIWPMTAKRAPELLVLESCDPGSSSAKRRGCARRSAGLISTSECCGPGRSWRVDRRGARDRNHSGRPDAQLLVERHLSAVSAIRRDSLGESFIWIPPVAAERRQRRAERSRRVVTTTRTARCRYW